MLEEFIAQLFKEFDLGKPPAFEKDGGITLEIASFPISMVKLDRNTNFLTHVSAKIAPLPTHEKEEFLLKLMSANFLSQGTGGSTLGLKEDDSFLTLSLTLPHDVDYRSFKDAVEEFINYLEYWKVETARYINNTID